jgi:hypothetical protein
MAVLTKALRNRFTEIGRTEPSIALDGSVRLTRLSRADPILPRRSCSGGRRRPRVMRCLADAAQGGSGDQVLLDVEIVLDGGVCGAEPLG